MTSCFFLLPFIILFGCGNNDNKSEKPDEESKEIVIIVSPAELSLPGKGASRDIVVTSNEKWNVASDREWCTVSPVSGYAGNTSVRISSASNYTGDERSAILTFTSGTHSETYSVRQETIERENYVPAGYSLVWSDEFDHGKMPDVDEWWYETGDHGWGNNELQNYVAGVSGVDTCARVSDGTLKIVAKKKADRVISVRMNTRRNWTYGYFEACMKLPTGKGTWPAFWMLPQNIENWPDDGEIDIMEEVGYNPNYVSSSIHCKAYNHLVGTQKTSEKFVPDAQTDFHVYAVEWTEDYIYGFIDGERYFTFANDKRGDKNTWPFNVPFYLKLNLAWGGNWGGAQGVDESVLPAIYEIDYVRTYQKKSNP